MAAGDGFEQQLPLMMPKQGASTHAANDTGHSQETVINVDGRQTPLHFKDHRILEV